MLRALFVLCLVSVAAPALAQEYQSKELADAARDWRRELIDSVPANKKQPAQIAGWRRTADAEYQAKRYAAAIERIDAAPSPTAPMTVSSGCGSPRASSPPRTTMRWRAPTTPI